MATTHPQDILTAHKGASYNNLQAAEAMGMSDTTFRRHLKTARV